MSLQPVVTIHMMRRNCSSIEYNLCLIILACDSGNCMYQNVIFCVYRKGPILDKLDLFFIFSVLVHGIEIFAVCGNLVGAQNVSEIHMKIKKIER